MSGGGEARPGLRDGLTRLPLYLTSGNFPSRAANIIQVTKMACAYHELLPRLELVSLTGPLVRRSGRDERIARLFGLERRLPIRLLPLRLTQTELCVAGQRPAPRWFSRVAAAYARWRDASLVFTRDIPTALETIRAGIPTVLESHLRLQRLPPRTVEVLHDPLLLGLVTITRPLAENFVRLGLDPARLLTEPDGVDLERYTRSPDRLQARERLDLDAGTFTCVYTGHLYGDRGIGELLEAAARIPDARFLLVGGWDDDVERHRDLVVDRGLDNVTLTGHVPPGEVALYQLAADVLVMQYGSRLPTRAHCSPLKLFEYMAAGRAIVASDFPILRTVLEHGRNAHLVRPDTVEDLVDAIRRLRHDHDYARGLGDAARLDARRFSWSGRASRILREVGDRESAPRM